MSYLFAAPSDTTASIQNREPRCTWRTRFDHVEAADWAMEDDVRPLGPIRYRQSGTCEWTKCGPSGFRRAGVNNRPARVYQRPRRASRRPGLLLVANRLVATAQRGLDSLH